MEIMGYKPLEQDYRIWMVINPATWLIPMFVALAALAVLVHLYAFSLPGQGFHAEAAPAAPEAAATPAK